MKKLIEFIKRIFTKKTLALSEGEAAVKENYSKQKENFKSNIIIENNRDNVLVLQIRFEEGIIKEEELSNEEISKLKDLYCNQIANLINSINNYKLKLSEDAQ